jgi:hypothetical protein
MNDKKNYKYGWKIKQFQMEVCEKILISNPEVQEKFYLNHLFLHFKIVYFTMHKGNGNAIYKKK